MPCVAGGVVGGVAGDKPGGVAVPTPSPPFFFGWPMIRSLLIILTILTVNAGQLTRAVAQAPGESAVPQVSPAAAAAYTSAAALQDQGLYDLAIDEWQALLTKFADDPIVPRAYYNLGVCQFQLGEFDDAAEQFAKLADPVQHPAIAEQALANLGLTLFNAAQQQNDQPARADRLNRAVGAFDKLIATFPDGPQAPSAWRYRGDAMMLQNEPEAAAAAYRRLITGYAESPERPVAMLGLADALLSLDKANEAEPVLSELISSNPAEDLLAQAYRARGDARLASGDFQAAAGDFAKAASTAKLGADEATQRQAYALFQAGDYAAAVEVYDTLAAKQPESRLAAEARLAAAKCLISDKNHADAVPRLVALWQADPTAANASTAHWLVQSLLASDGDLAQASEVVEQALATNPDPAWAAELQLDRADLLYRQGNRTAAASAYADLAKRYVDQPVGKQAAKLAARTALETGDNALASDLAEAALAGGMGENSDAEIRQVAAEASRLKGDFKAAAEQYQQLIEKYPSNPQRPAWSVRLATCLASQEQWQAVVTELSPLASELSEDDTANALLLLANAQAKLGQLRKAIERLSQLLERFPQHDAVPQALFDRGTLFTQFGSNGAAEQDFALLLKRFAGSPLAGYARYALATSQFRREDFAAAAATLKPFEKATEPPASRGRFLLASTYFEQGAYRETLSLLPSAEAAAAEKLYLQGVCEARLGRIRDSQATLANCLEAEGAAAVADRALYELAWAQDGADYRAKAGKLFARLADEYPESLLAAEANFRAGEADYAAGRFDEAKRRLLASAAGTQDASLAEKARHLVGWVLYDQQQFDDALAAFDVQLTEYAAGKLAADAQLMRAECWFAQEKFAEAITAYRAALTVESLRADLRPLGVLHLGQALGQQKQWEQAAEALGAADGESPYAAQTRYELAWSLHKLGKNDQALALFTKLADQATGALSARSRFVIGELEFAAGEHEQAVRTFFKVAYGYGGREAPAEVHEWQSQSLFEAARCLEQLDRRRPALKLYAEVVERFPDTEKAELARQRLQSAAVP